MYAPLKSFIRVAWYLCLLGTFSISQNASCGDGGMPEAFNADVSPLLSISCLTLNSHKPVSLGWRCTCSQWPRNSARPTHVKTMRSLPRQHKVRSCFPLGIIQTQLAKGVLAPTVRAHSLCHLSQRVVPGDTMSSRTCRRPMHTEICPSSHDQAQWSP